MSRRQGTGARIVIIGGGAAGLAAAHRLVSLGYENVIVLESGDRVGGKCWSVDVRGRAFEMGAIGFPGRKNTFLKLAKSLGLPATGTWGYSYASGGRTRRLPPGLGLRLPGHVARLARTLKLLQRPGFDSVNHDRSLSAPAERWFKEQGVASVDAAVRPLVTGLGYGFFSDIPAAYVLKNVALFRPDVFQLLDGGSQAVWGRVARAKDVRLGHTVTRVERSKGAPIVVSTNRGTLEADRLIIATPPAETLAFLDRDNEVTPLLERFRCFRYHVLVCDAVGLKPAHYGFLFDGCDRLTSGRPLVYSRRRPTDREVVLYSYIDPARPLEDDEIVATNQAYLSSLGARIGTVHRQHTWSYFPHVDSKSFADGVHAKLEARQGEANTYFVGEALAYPLVRLVVEHAFDTVDRFFSNSGSPVRSS